MTGYGPPDDPSEAPTGKFDYGNYDDYGQPLDESKPEPTPWYRRPAALIAWAVLTAALIALAVYGILEMTKGGGGSTPASTSTTTPTTTATAPTSSATTTEPVAPAPTTVTSTPTTTAPATTAPTSTSIDEGHHHHHHL